MPAVPRPIAPNTNSAPGTRADAEDIQPPKPEDLNRPPSHGGGSFDQFLPSPVPSLLGRKKNKSTKGTGGNAPGPNAPTDPARAPAPSAAPALPSAGSSFSPGSNPTDAQREAWPSRGYDTLPPRTSAPSYSSGDSNYGSSSPAPEYWPENHSSSGGNQGYDGYGGAGQRSASSTPVAEGEYLAGRYGGGAAGYDSQGQPVRTDARVTLLKWRWQDVQV